MLADYRYALIIAYDGQEDVRQRRKMQRMLAELEHTIFLDGYYKVFAMGAGPCRLCPTCDPNQPCKFPYLARPSMESCGIDVYATCRNAGIKLEVVTCYEGRPRYINLLLLE